MHDATPYVFIDECGVTTDVVRPYGRSPHGTRLHDPATTVPTTVAEFGSSLYAVTAGFAPPAPDFVVRVSK